MSNSFHNHLKLSADSESIIESAKQIFEKWAAKWTTNTAAISEVFDKRNELHICEYNLITLREPPSDLYAEIKTIEGIKLEATFTSDMQHYDKRYRWTGEGDKYEVVEEGLTYPNGYVQTIELDDGCSRIEITVPDPFDQTIIGRSELGNVLRRLAFEPMDALEAGLTVFMDGHRHGAARGRGIDQILHTAADPYRKLFDGIEDDEARFDGIAGSSVGAKRIRPRTLPRRFGCAGTGRTHPKN